MEKTKQQFGKAVIDGKEKKYCQIYVVVDDDEAINRISLTEQFKLLAESFWIFLKEQEELKKHMSIFEDNTGMDFDDSALKKGWF